MNNLQLRSGAMRFPQVPGARLLAALLLWFALPVHAAEPPSDAGDFAAIHAVVFDYLEGINTVDRERLERAFHPGAELKSVDEEGGLLARPIGEVIDRWMNNAPGTRSGEVISMEINDGKIARVVFDYNGEYTDFLTVARVKGRWQIIDKVFIEQ